MSGMYDLNGWTPITCEESDEARVGTRPCSSLTDPSGTYGTPVIYTEWCDEQETPVLRDYRWPNSDRDCAHYVPDPGGPR